MIKGHSGEFVTKKKGGVYSLWTKLKLKTPSLMESEKVPVGEELPKLIWYRYIWIEQGGNFIEDSVLQVSQSTMLMENHG